MVQVVTSKTGPNSEFTKPRDFWNSNKPIIFLAGPCPRHDYDKLDWRTEAIKYLEEAGFDGIVFNPTNKYFQRNAERELENQTAWEIEAMNCSNKVVFWIPRSEENPAFTTNIELGGFLNAESVNEFEIGWPDTAIKNEYIGIRLDMINKKYYTTLKDLMESVARRFK